MPDTFPTPWLNKYNEFHIPHDVPVLTGPFTRLLTTQPVIIQTALPSFMEIHAFPISGSICSQNASPLPCTVWDSKRAIVWRSCFPTFRRLLSHIGVF